MEAYQELREQGKTRFIGFSVDGPWSGVEKMIGTGGFDVMQIHHNLMYQSTCDSFGNRGVSADAEAQEIDTALMSL